LEGEPVDALHEADRIARLVTAETVVELVVGVDRERRRALVVEGAEAGVAAADPPQLGVGADERDHVDRVLDAVDRLLRVERHAGEASAATRRGVRARRLVCRGMSYTIKNLREVEDLAAKYGYSEMG